MKISRFWAKGYRSLRDVTLDGLGDFNVFYGPNGSGKSNILVAINSLFALLEPIAAASQRQRFQSNVDSEFGRIAGEVATSRNIIKARDVFVGDLPRRFVLGAECRTGESGNEADIALSLGRRMLQVVIVEVTADWSIDLAPRLGISLVFDGEPVNLAVVDNIYPALMALLVRLSGAYSLVDADRTPRFETTAQARGLDQVVAWHLREGRLKNALFVAQNSPDPILRRRFRVLREMLQGPPLMRRPFDVVQDPTTQEVDIREPLPGGDVSLDLVGLGVAQLYAMLAHIVLLGSRSVGIEEPEAHLHAPTSGRSLRAVLKTILDERLKDQLFIATHSNLFDLDPTGYWDVSMQDGATHVERKPLHEVDAHHLYEPGPAKHALEQLLRYAPAEEVVSRRPDGSPITAGKMLQLLQSDDAQADGFLDDLHGAALRIVRLKTQREGNDR